MSTKRSRPKPYRRSRKPADWRSGLRDAGPYIGLGMQLAAAMVFFTGGGILLDHYLDLTPWLTIIGALLGITAIFLQIYRVTVTLGRKDKHDE